jgi:peptidoglycan/xylan/chitin deacetylase (PgdA/CDA1 family)
VFTQGASLPLSDLPAISRTPRVPLLAALAGALVLGCAEPSVDSAPPKQAPPREEAVKEAVKIEAPPPFVARTQLDGRAFPDKVIALTWDDGPDAHTRELAEYLASEGVSGTFFVVAEWDEQLSSEPGKGTRVYETGHQSLPILGDLVELGHRLGNHTFNHALLSDVDAAMAEDQLRENQRRLDPFLGNELRIFRVPGGAWNASASFAVDADPQLAKLVGPFRWDIDRKDWESSLYCRSSRPKAECERTGPEGRLRVRPSVIAQRYLKAIEGEGHGIVLMHDRVGHVGSTYALQIARELIPALKARGFVFVAPVLQLSPLTRRFEGPLAGSPGRTPAPFHLGDIDGDGRADLCARGPLGVACAVSFERAGSEGDRLPLTVFRAPRLREHALTDAAGWALASSAPSAQLADVTGDGRADLCARGPEGLVCAAALASGAFGTLQSWSATHAFPAAPAEEPVPDLSDADGWGNDAGYYETIRFADLDGDHKADVCGRSAAGLVCAQSLGNGFAHARLWLPELGDAQGWAPPAYSSSVQLGDVDGDGRADVCARGREGLVCALARGQRFTHLRKWSTGADFSDADSTPWAKDASFYGTVRLADLNGDGRADVCARSREGLMCALSTGRSFTRATVWLPELGDGQGVSAARATSLQLGDINGDGRADACVRDAEGVACALAP